MGERSYQTIITFIHSEENRGRVSHTSQNAGDLVRRGRVAGPSGWYRNPHPRSAPSGFGGRRRVGFVLPTIAALRCGRACRLPRPCYRDLAPRRDARARRYLAYSPVLGVRGLQLLLHDSGAAAVVFMVCEPFLITPTSWFFSGCSCRCFSNSVSACYGRNTLWLDRGGQDRTAAFALCLSAASTGQAKPGATGK